MGNALLVGNGFTSELIKEYSNKHMMCLLRNQAHDIYVQANQLFDPFRKKILPDLEDAELSISKSLEAHIKHTIESLSANLDEDSFEEIFLGCGLVYETQKSEISSVENLLKVVYLFRKSFSADAVEKITHIANRIYFNEGNNGISAVPPIEQLPLREWITQYDWVFTTNYDCVLDDLVATSPKVCHLHGGFYFQDKRTLSRQKLLPENAYLVWGINGKYKQQQTAGSYLFTSDSASRPLKDKEGYLLKDTTLLEQYLRMLQYSHINHLDIFGYSGENDQHINSAVAKNISIKSVRYYCAPEDVGKQSKLLEIKKRFNFSWGVALSLSSWGEVWGKINA